jgi:hypothetical protein
MTFAVHDWTLAESLEFLQPFSGICSGESFAMADARDITSAAESAWNVAVIRELVPRRLVSRDRLGRPEILEACRELGVRWARLSVGRGGDCALWLRAG